MYILTPEELAENLNSDGWWDPQCRVTTKRGTRCQHRLFGGQQYTIIDDQHHVSEAVAVIFHTGICPFHSYVGRDK